MRKSRMPPKVLQHLMGHSDIKVMLDTYADVFDNFQSISVEKSDKGRLGGVGASRR